MQNERHNIIELYSQIVEISHDGIMVLSADYVIIYTNESAHRAIKGNMLIPIVGEVFEYIFKDNIIECLNEKKHVKFEMPIYRYGATHREGIGEIICNKVLWEDNDTTYFLYIRDITDQKTAEIERQRLKDLKLEVTLDTQVRQWKDMLLDINHETRSAVSAIINIFDSIAIIYNMIRDNRECVDCKPPNGVATCCKLGLNDIGDLAIEGVTAAERIRLVLNTMAEQARAKSNPDPELFNAYEEAEREINMLRRHINADNLNIIVIGDENIVMDAVKYQFQMIIRNILENAIKACTEMDEDNSEILIEFTQCPQKKTGTIVIADTGIGIPQTIIDKLGTNEGIGQFKMGDKRGMKLIKAFCNANNIKLEISSDTTNKYMNRYNTMFKLIFNIYSTGELFKILKARGKDAS